MCRSLSSKGGLSVGTILCPCDNEMAKLITGVKGLGIYEGFSSVIIWPSELLVRMSFDGNPAIISECFFIKNICCGLH